MTDLISIGEAILKRKVFVLGIIVVSTILALVLSLLLPKKFLAETSVLPANSQLNDKTRFFSENMRELYSGFGTADDLDRLYATAKSGVTFNALVDSFNLVEYYGLQKRGVGARDAAIKKLRANSYILKSEYGELKIGVLDKDPEFAAKMANAIVYNIQKVTEGMFTEFYSTTLQKMETALQEKESELRGMEKRNPDSLEHSRNRSGLAADISQYRKIIGEYRIAMLNPPPSLIVLEKALPTVKPEKPNIVLNTIAAFLVSAFIAIVVSVLIVKKEN
jgi:capsular polysaccharide biosynthesis protein